MSSQPPYGDPRAYYGQQPPQPPRRRVRKGMLVVGIMLMVLSPILFCAGLLWSLVPLLSADATVPTNGTPTRVDLPADTTRALYVDSSSSWGETSCQVADAAGAAIDLGGVSGDVEVNGYTAERTFDTGDGDVTVTCTTADDLFAGSDEVRIGAVPGKGFVVAIMLSLGLPALVFLFGLVLLIVALVRRRPA